jgi:hypothetical protein
VLNAGSPEANVVVLGTALHRECIVCQLQRTPGWETHLFRSIIEWSRRMDLWQQWEAVLHCHDDPDREARARLFYGVRSLAEREFDQAFAAGRKVGTALPSGAAWQQGVRNSSTLRPCCRQVATTLRMFPGKRPSASLSVP